MLYEKVLNLLEEPDTYEVSYYLQVGQHGNSYMGNDFNRAKSDAKRLAKESEKDDDTWMVEITNFKGDDGKGKSFNGIIYYMTDDYINKVLFPYTFSDRKSYNAYLKAAKQNMKTKKPVEW